MRQVTRGFIAGSQRQIAVGLRKLAIMLDQRAHGVGVTALVVEGLRLHQRGLRNQRR